MLFILHYFAAAENLRAQQTEGLSLVFPLESCMFVWYLHIENKPETLSSFTNGKNGGKLTEHRITASSSW